MKSSTIITIVVLVSLATFVLFYGLHKNSIRYKKVSKFKNQTDIKNQNIIHDIPLISMNSSGFSSKNETDIKNTNKIINISSDKRNVIPDKDQNKLNPKNESENKQIENNSISDISKILIQNSTSNTYSELGEKISSIKDLVNDQINSKNGNKSANVIYVNIGTININSTNPTNIYNIDNNLSNPNKFNNSNPNLINHFNSNSTKNIKENFNFDKINKKDNLIENNNENIKNIANDSSNKVNQINSANPPSQNVNTSPFVTNNFGFSNSNITEFNNFIINIVNPVINNNQRIKSLDDNKDETNFFNTTEKNNKIKSKSEVNETLVIEKNNYTNKIYLNITNLETSKLDKVGKITNNPGINSSNNRLKKCQSEIKIKNTEFINNIINETFVELKTELYSQLESVKKNLKRFKK